MPPLKKWPLLNAPSKHAIFLTAGAPPQISRNVPPSKWLPLKMVPLNAPPLQKNTMKKMVMIATSETKVKILQNSIYFPEFPADKRREWKSPESFSSQENSGEFEGFISNWKRRSKTLKNSEYLLLWIKNERNSFCVVLTDQVKWKGRVCALFLEISIENFFLQFLKENVLFCWKKCIFWRSVRTFLPQVKICRRVSIKMMPIPMTYVLTLNKKNKIFFQGRPPKKFNGGGGGKLKTHKKLYFFIWQKFLAGVAKNRPDENFWPWWSTVFVICNLDQKKKSYDILKSENAKFWKIAFPPPPPIENETIEFLAVFLGWQSNQKKMKFSYFFEVKYASWEWCVLGCNERLSITRK